MLQYHCTLTDDEYIDFNLFTLRSNPAYKRALLLCRMMVPAMLFLLLLLNIINKYDGIVIFAVMYGVAALIWVFAVKPLYDFITLRNIKSQLKHSRSLYTPEYTLYFNEDHILDISPQQETKVFYEKIERVCVNRGAVYIYPTSVSAMILPAAVFPADADRDRLLSFLAQRRSDLQIERSK